MTTNISKTSKLPVGPLHVALEEPMYFRVDVEGETVRDVDINAGHVHRGIEYLSTKRSIYQNVVLTERICSLCSNSHPETFVMAAEQIAGLEIPERAAYLRVIAAEIKRIASHLFNVGILAHLTGYDTLFMHAMQVREIMQDLKETVFGNRMDIARAVHRRGALRPRRGDDGVSHGRARQAGARSRRACQNLPQQRLDPAAHQRRRRADPRARRSPAAWSGRSPAPRGIDYDVRVVAPYAAYDRLNVRRADAARRRCVVAGDDPAGRDRRIIQLIRECLRDLPEGPTHLNERPDIPEGRAIAKCEAPRGELSTSSRPTAPTSPSG